MRRIHLINFTPKRITAFVGHYGSGKTELALNFAAWLKEKHEKVIIADLDTVNPYYRTKDAEDQLEAKGIAMLSSPFASSNVDLPTMPGQVFTLFNDDAGMVVMDIGGDDDGATVLGTYSSRFKENTYDLFCVINQRRFLTKTADEAVSYIRDIEAASRLKVTGIVNNTNLSWETTPEVILDSLAYGEAVSQKSGIPLVMTAALSKFEQELDGRAPNLFPIDIYIKYTWQT